MSECGYPELGCDQPKGLSNKEYNTRRDVNDHCEPQFQLPMSTYTMHAFIKV